MNGECVSEVRSDTEVVKLRCVYKCEVTVSELCVCVCVFTSLNVKKDWGILLLIRVLCISFLMLKIAIH